MAQGRKKKEAPPEVADSRAPKGFLEDPEEKVQNFMDREKYPDLVKEAAALYTPIKRTYENREEQNRNIDEYWKIWSATPDENQQYMGNSQCYIPAVRDATQARVKRALNQLFPSRYKHCEALGADNEVPQPQLSLLEHYIRSTNLKSIVRSDLIAGDITGQWALYIDWTRSYRRITKLVKRNPILEESELGSQVRRTSPGVEGAEGFEPEPLLDPTAEEEATEEEDILTEGPEIVDIASEDIAVVPPTCNDIEKAEISAVRLRMSREAVKRMVDEGVFVLDEKWQKNPDVSAFMDDRQTGGDGSIAQRNPDKKRADEAGVRTEGTTRYLEVLECHAKLDFPDPENEGKTVTRLGYVYFGGRENILGIIIAPQWGGKRPIITASIERVKGSFYGISKVEPVKYLQWNLNDYWNMGQDSAMYSLMPIIMSDPLSNPNWASMVIGLAAVWAVDPTKTKFEHFPQLYKDAAQQCTIIKGQIWESMGVNEMMMGHVPSGRKNNAMMGMFQQEQSLDTIDHAERYEEMILNPLVERMMEYDAQWRTDELTIMQQGEIGVRAKMAKIPVQQWDQRYQFWWSGTAYIKSMGLLQQKIAWMNVLRGVPPQQLNGRRLDVTPILMGGTEDMFGPELAAKILIDERDLFTVEPATENEIMHNNMPVDVHEADNDMVHLQVHQEGAKATGDPNGRFRAHIARHMMQLQAKRQKQAMQMSGEQGVPGGAAPGVPGSPRPGAQPSPQRPVQGPPGLMQQDNLPGAPGRG